MLSCLYYSLWHIFSCHLIFFPHWCEFFSLSYMLLSIFSFLLHIRSHSPLLLLLFLLLLFKLVLFMLASSVYLLTLFCFSFFPFFHIYTRFCFVFCFFAFFFLLHFFLLIIIFKPLLRSYPNRLFLSFLFLLPLLSFLIGHFSYLGLSSMRVLPPFF